MVRPLAALKLRLLWNGLRADIQRRIGLPLVVAGGTLGALALARTYLAHVAALAPTARGPFSVWAATIFFFVWVVLPVLLFPIDESLDPANLALLPITGWQLTRGLLVTAMISPVIGALAVPIVANARLWAVGWGVLYAWAAAALLLTMSVAGARMFTTAVSAILHTRRGRDLSVLIVVALGGVTFASQQVISGAVSRLGLGGAVLAHPIGPLSWLIPSAAAQRAAVAGSSGDHATALASLAVAALWTIALMAGWRALLLHNMVTPDQAGRSERTGAAGRIAEGARGPVSAVIRKEFAFYLRDPRQRLVWTGAVIFLALAGASVLVGTGGIGLFRYHTWLPLLAPALVLFVGLPIALNQFGWERNAASFLFALPISPRRLLVGKNVATSVGLVVETTLLGLLLAAVSGGWRALAVVPGLAVCAIGCQLAVGNLVSVITPLRLPREGSDVFSQATEQGCLAMIAQLTGFAIIGALLVVPGSVAVLAVEFGAVIPIWLTSAVSIGWGLAAYGISLLIAGWLLRRRLPEILSWVEVV